jgi:hypothetical protein
MKLGIAPSSAFLAVVVITSSARADAFDDYDSIYVKKTAESADHARKMPRITREELVAASQVLPRIDGVFLIVHTNDNRWAKLIVHPAAQKVDMAASIPVLLIERFVTFKEGEERARVAEGKNLRLFPDFRMSLDIGAIVPSRGLSSDLRFVNEDGMTFIEPIGKAELFLVEKHLAEATPAKGTKVVVGAKFEKELFAGKYKLYDDGKAPSELQLAVDAKGEVAGFLYSGATGAKYEVFGKVGPNPMHGIQFTVLLPRTRQLFTGWMFTQDAAAIAGFSNIEGRESGFYAVREQ